MIMPRTALPVSIWAAGTVALAAAAVASGPPDARAAGGCHKAQYTVKVGSYSDDFSEGNPDTSLTVRNELVLRWCESSSGGFRAVRKSCYFRALGRLFKDSKEVKLPTTKFRRDLRESGCGVRAVVKIAGKLETKQCTASIRVRYRPNGRLKPYPQTKQCNDTGFTARVERTG